MDAKNGRVQVRGSGVRVTSVVSTTLTAAPDAPFKAGRSRLLRIFLCTQTSKVYRAATIGYLYAMYLFIFAIVVFEIEACWNPDIRRGYLIVVVLSGIDPLMLVLAALIGWTGSVGAVVFDFVTFLAVLCSTLIMNDIAYDNFGHDYYRPPSAAPPSLSQPNLQEPAAPPPASPPAVLGSQRIDSAGFMVMIIFLSLRVITRSTLFKLMDVMEHLLLLDHNSGGTTIRMRARPVGVPIHEVRATIHSFEDVSKSLVAKLLFLLEEADSHKDGFLSPTEHAAFVHEALLMTAMVGNHTQDLLEREQFVALAEALRAKQTAGFDRQVYGLKQVFVSMVRLFGKARRECVMTLLFMTIYTVLQNLNTNFLGNLVSKAQEGYALWQFNISEALAQADRGNYYVNLLGPSAGSYLPLEQIVEFESIWHDFLGEIALYISIVMVNLLVQTLVGIGVAKLCARIMKALRSDILSRLVHANTAFLARFPVGKVSSIFSSDLARVEILLKITVWSFLQPILAVVTALIFTFSINVRIGTLFVSLFPTLFFLDAIQNIAAEHSKTYSDLNTKMNSAFANTANCCDVVRISDAATFLMERFEGSFEALRQATYSSQLWSHFMTMEFNVVVKLFTSVTQVASLILLVWSKIDLGDYSKLVGYAKAMATPLSTVAGFFRNAVSNGGSLQLIDALLLCGSDLQEDPCDDKPALAPLSRSVALSEVDFRYAADGPAVLSGFSCDIVTPAYVVLCGGSGSGKSTILQLIMQFREPMAGRITFDGVDLSECSLSSFKAQLGVVFQQTMILDGSVHDNIAFGTGASREQVVAAAQQAEVDEIIMEKLPAGYDTHLGTGSSGGMSGGQLQRICLARALCRKPKLLLLDEATSALDPATEKSIVGTFERLRKDYEYTIISVSHRPMTALHADQIIVLDKGTLAESGTFDELMQAKGFFERLVRSA